METINKKELGDENIYPDEGVLRSVLEDSFDTYRSLLQLFEDNEMTHEWRFYRDGKAWLCKVQKKKRTIFWMSAWRGFMQVTAYFPHRFLDRVYELDISKGQKEKLRSTKDVGRSKPCIFEVHDCSVIADLEKVMLLKNECR